MPSRPTPGAGRMQARRGDDRLFAEAAAALGAGDLVRAEKLCRKLAKRRPEDPALEEMSGLIQMQKGATRAAAARFRRAIDGGLKTAGVYNSLALALGNLGEADAAVQAARRAAELDPARAELQVNLGNRLRNAGRIEEALVAYGKAIELRPGLVAAWVGLGNAYTALGNGEQAMARYRRALELQPDHARAFYHLALTAKGGLGAPDQGIVEYFRGLVAQNALGPGDAALVHNALGHVADRQGECDEAFAHFRDFNQLLRAERKAQGRSFVRNAHSQWIDQIIAAFPAGAFDGDMIPGHTSEQPLFIVGMPRSGTTLVEQILARHPAVAAGGELLAMEGLVAGLEDYPNGVAKLTPDSLSTLATRYLEALGQVDRDAQRVTDKLPLNFLHLGFIARLLPGSRVVHCTRDPVDTCLSCYFQNFPSGQPYTNDLVDLGTFYRDYARLMAHWNQALPTRPVEVAYETLVRDPESTIRWLLEMLGLPWDAACLRFWESNRPVLTASQWQVRQPITAKAIDRSRPYRAHLGPLLEALGDLAA